MFINEENYTAAIEQAALRYGTYPNDFYKGCEKDPGTVQKPALLIPFKSVFKPIPRDRWKQLILDQRGTFLKDLYRHKLPIHNQGHTPLCWAHATVRAAEYSAVHAGQAPRTLSAEHLAYKVTGGRMRGGYPSEAIEELAKTGTCEQHLWPLNSFIPPADRQLLARDARQHVTLAWLKLSDWDDQITAGFRRLPVAIGLRWWGHAVCQTGPCILPDGTVGIDFDNSWDSDWGDNGTGQLTERRGTADLSAVCPLAVTWDPD